MIVPGGNAIFSAWAGVGTGGDTSSDCARTDWLTRPDAIIAATAVSADNLRDLIGLSICVPFLLECNPRRVVARMLSFAPRSSAHETSGQLNSGSRTDHRVCKNMRILLGRPITGYIWIPGYVK